MRRRPSSRALLFITALAGVAAAMPTGAHEIGTTRAVATFLHDGTYSIDVTTDAAVLLARLEIAQHRPRSSPESIAQMQQGFDQICAEVARHVTLAFDGRVSEPQVACVVDKTITQPEFGLAALGVTVTLRGSVPDGTKNFTWRYGLTYASHALIVKGDAARGASADQTVWLEGDDASKSLPLRRLAPPPTRADIARTYFGLGFTHILPKGLDHILFVLGIYLLSRRLKPMLWQVSAFTLAHSITLGMTLYGIIDLPSRIVEPLIALSIVYVAVENLVTSDLKPWRVGLVFAFGLLHGMGFAGVLRELELPRSEFVTGLAAFNLGVEAGQLTIILSAFLIVGSWARHRKGYRRFVVVPGSAAIALTGLFWTMQRLP